MSISIPIPREISLSSLLVALEAIGVDGNRVHFLDFQEQQAPISITENLINVEKPEEKPEEVILSEETTVGFRKSNDEDVNTESEENVDEEYDGCIPMEIDAADDIYETQ